MSGSACAEFIGFLFMVIGGVILAAGLLAVAAMWTIEQLMLLFRIKKAFVLFIASNAKQIVEKPNAGGQGRREATYPEPACSALDSEEPDDREERCDSCGETGRCLMRLCPMCYELNGGTHD